MPVCRQLRAVPVILAAALGLGAPTSKALEVGLFFDEAGTSCVGQIRPFGQVQVYALAFLDEETDFAGALLSLKLPVGISIVGDTGGIVWPKDCTRTGNLLAETGIDLQFQRCPRRSGVVELFHMVLEDLTFGDLPRPDLRIEVGGAAIPGDSTLLKLPQLKICDGQNPDGYSEIREMQPLLATLNCSSDCPCTVSVTTQTWGTVKRRFQED